MALLSFESDAPAPPIPTKIPVILSNAIPMLSNSLLIPIFDKPIIHFITSRLPSQLLLCLSLCVLAFHMHQARLNPLLTVLDDERCQLPALQTATIDALGVISDREATARVMAVDDCHALVGGDTALECVE